MRVILLSLIIAAVGAIAWMMTHDVGVRLNPDVRVRIAESVTGVVYQLDNKRWTSFPLPPKTQSVRLITNADLPSNLNFDPDDKWRYAIEYELVDKKGNVVEKSQYHYLAVMKKYDDERFDKPVTPSFYFDQSTIPSSGKVVNINFHGKKDIEQFRVRLLQKDPAIQDVVIRVSVREYIAENKLDYLWRRMSPDTRIMKTKGNIYPPELLFESEIMNLLTKRNQPIGPSGITGRDYVSKTMYISKERAGEEVPPPILPLGLFVDKAVTGVIPLPPGENKVKLNIFSTELGQDPKLGSNIIITWVGRTGNLRETFDLKWDGKPIWWERKLAGGMITIESEGNLIARAFIDADKKQEEITPSPYYIRTYITSNNDSVSFKINHIDQHPTPFRVDIRFLMPTEYLVSNTPDVTYELVNDKGVIVKTGSLPVDSIRTKKFELRFLGQQPNEKEKELVELGDALYIIKANDGSYNLAFLREGKYTQKSIQDNTLVKLLGNKQFKGQVVAESNLVDLVRKEVTSLGGQVPSNYERVSNQPFEYRVSNPTSYYFSLPDTIKLIKLKSSEPALISAYNRPYNLTRIIKIPEDSFYNDPNQMRQPGWFVLKPVDFGKLMLNNRSVLLTGQYRPPEPNPDLIKGDYIWNNYYPSGSWLGRYLLSPLEDIGGMREEALPSVFQEIKPDVNTIINVRSINGVKVVNPTIAYRRNGTDTSHVKVFLDGELHFKGILSGNSGEIRVPPIQVGKHDIKIVGDKTATFYINYSTATKQGMLKRFVNRLDEKGLTFYYEKEDNVDERLSLRLHVPKGLKERSLVSVRVEAPQFQVVGPLRSWSFLDRKFDIKPNDEEYIPVLGAGNQLVDKGEFFSILLGEDIPPGKYLIRVNLLKGNAGYIAVSRIIPGYFDERRVFIEPEVYRVQLPR